MKLIKEKGLTFDDVLLVPRYNEIESRLHVSLKTRLTKEIQINSPIVSANMDTVTGKDMMIAMHGRGVGILHRFMDIEETKKQLKEVREALRLEPHDIGGPICVSIGAGKKGDKRAHAIKYLCDVICIDVAHGHSLQVLKMIESIKNWCQSPQIIAGNVATTQGVRDLINAGADAIKVGIGPGSLCTTRLVTGNGVPQFSAIIECAEEADIYNVPIIADGGIRTSGDIVKALAAGASSVMVGSLLAGTKETPGEIWCINENGQVLAGGKDCKYNPKGTKLIKAYRGMASKNAMIDWKGDYHAAPEGEATQVPYKGFVKPIIDDLLAGIRSGMTYQGVDNIEDLQQVAKFRLISPNCLIENRPHGK